MLRMFRQLQYGRSHRYFMVTDNLTTEDFIDIVVTIDRLLVGP